MKQYFLDGFLRSMRFEDKAEPKDSQQCTLQAALNTLIETSTQLPFLK